MIVNAMKRLRQNLNTWIFYTKFKYMDLPDKI